MTARVLACAVQQIPVHPPRWHIEGELTGGGGGQGRKGKNCFGLEHARFEASVEHPCKYLNACVCGSGDWGIIECQAVQ